MRSNKCRAWDKKNKKMVYYSPYTMLIDGLERDEYWEENYRRFPFDYIEMGSVSFDDRNGEEIYEGDIIDLPGYDQRIVMEWGYISADGEAFGWRRIDLDDAIVIGNIHENPELLKGKN